jgi:hypothetical protein
MTSQATSISVSSALSSGHQPASSVPKVCTYAMLGIGGRFVGYEVHFFPFQVDTAKASGDYSKGEGNDGTNTMAQTFINY